MRGLVTLALFAILPACEPQARAPRSGDTLVLSLGAGHGSLHAALQPPPGPRLRAAQRTAPEPVGVVPRHEPVPQAPEPPPRREEAPGFQVVALGDGETLYGLCKRHLGNGARWVEVLELNGWNEREAMRLRTGQQVKLPPR